jgi:hypothetical protein
VQPSVLIASRYTGKERDDFLTDFSIAFTAFFFVFAFVMVGFPRFGDLSSLLGELDGKTVSHRPPSCKHLINRFLKRRADRPQRESKKDAPLLGAMLHSP